MGLTGKALTRSLNPSPPLSPAHALKLDPFHRSEISPIMMRKSVQVHEKDKDKDKD